MEILSETEIAQDWIAQFDEEDKGTAKLILDSLIYVSNKDLHIGLSKLLKEYIDKHQNEYIALFAVKEVVDDTSYWEDGREQLSVTGRDGIGSEADISYFCRDISKTERYLLNHPSINIMRERKCRHIICLNDIIGSGEQVRKFCNWLYNHKTIKSWVSSKYIDINICSYAGTDYGFRKLKKNKIISEILINQYIDYGISFWSQEERQKIENICYKYSIYTTREYFPLGYKNMFTFLYFDHKCPNTSPAILWAPSSKKWRSMFPTRPEIIIESNNYLLKRLVVKKILNYYNLTKSILFSHFSQDSKIMVLILNCFLQKRNKSNINRIISVMLGMPITTINKYIEKLSDMKLIDVNNKVTKMGKSLIRSAKK